MAFYFLAGAPVPGRIPSLLHHRALEHHRAPAAVMADWHTRATEALAAKAKPAGSLGLLEEWAAVLCTVQQTLAPVAEPQSVLVFCGDHGVKRADQSLSPFPPSVSQAVFRSLCAGISATAVLARTAGAHLAVVDVGLDGDVSDQRADANHSISVLHQKVACGTADFRTAPAMDEAELSRAIEVGRSAVAGEVSARQARVVAVGEVGIGNTTAAAALLASLTGASPADCCGRGTGLDDGGLRHKEETVARACEAHSEPLRSAGPLCGASRAREALRRVGGLELAAMTGAFLEAEERGVAAVVDGFISGVAALCAVRMRPSCRSHLLFATALQEEPSAVRGGEVLAEALGATPALGMGLRLGEGSGAALALPMVRAAASIVAEMGTLQQALALGGGGEGDV